MIKPLIQKVIVAINGSEKSLHAAMYGIIMARQYKCELKAVYVVDTASLRQLTMSGFLYKEESEKYEKNLLEDGNKYLQEIVSLGKTKGVKVQTELRKGTPWSEILHSAEDYRADLILLGGNENKGNVSTVYHDATGTTNMDIIGYAKFNVLVVHQKEINRLFKLY